MNPGCKWADEETEILRKMAAAGATLEQIALVLQGHTIESIRSKLKREGIVLAPLKPKIDMDEFNRFMAALGDPKCL